MKEDKLGPNPALDVQAEREALYAIAVGILKEATKLGGNEELALSAADASLAIGLAMADAIEYSTAKAYSSELISSDRHLKDLAGITLIQ